jgi:hypothetical protein
MMIAVLATFAAFVAHGHGRAQPKTEHAGQHGQIAQMLHE